MSSPNNAIPKPEEKDNSKRSPGGGVYDVLPDGTRVKKTYTNVDLKTLANSPLVKGSPMKMPEIPGITLGAPKMDPLDLSAGADTTS